MHVCVSVGLQVLNEVGFKPTGQELKIKLLPPRNRNRIRNVAPRNVFSIYFRQMCVHILTLKNMAESFPGIGESPTVSTSVTTDDDSWGVKEVNPLNTINKIFLYYYSS